MTGEGFLAFISIAQPAAREWARCNEERLGWTSRLLTDHVAILFEDDPSDAIRQCGNGWLIGTLFDRRATSLNSRSIDGDLRSLISNFWGAYLMIDRVGPTIRIFRDPSGAMPCYIHRSKHAVWVTNSAPMLVRAGVVKPQIDWRNLALILSCGGLPSSRTAIDGVSELLPGHRLAVYDDGVKTEQIWSPWDYAGYDPNANVADLTRHVRRAILDCVGAWGNRFERIVATVSGGLDSSIVLAGARRTRASVVGLTLSTNDPDGDERPFAREVSRYLGTPLTERPYDDADMVPFGTPYGRLPRPTGRCTAMAHDAMVRRTMNETDAQALFAGVGGDNVFGFSQSAAPVVDHYRSVGLRGCLPTVANICQLTGCSIFEAITSALRLNRNAPGYVWKADTRLLPPDIRQEAMRRPLRHPWLNGPDNALPGKAAHIASLLRIHNHMDNVNRFAGQVVINPLMSQPVVEACLQIQSWQWCLGGRDRAIARLAFADRLPPRIISRSTKGGPDGFANEFLSAHRADISDFVTCGELARHGLIDKAAVDAVLFSETPSTGSEQVRLLELIAAEAWIAHWQAMAPADQNARP